MLSLVSRPAHPDHHKSWVSPDAARAPRLLFISDAEYDDVYIYTMPALALKGTLTGFIEPQGMCSDASGNIWLANTEGGSDGGDMLQFSRTGTLLRTLQDPGYYPVGCAVSPSGDLAVINIISIEDDEGNVQVYHNATGEPTTYTSSNMFEYFFGGYDPSGNLFVAGEENISRTAATLAELPANTSTMTPITLSGATLGFPGLVQWYRTGNYWGVGDQDCTCVYWVTISGSTGTVTGTTDLGGPTGDLVQGVIGANNQKYLAGGLINFSSGSTINRWPWDAGGEPTNSISMGAASTYHEPIGAAISTK
jgi:hypothetical protein